MMNVNVVVNGDQVMINANFDDASLEIKDHVIKFIKSYRQINSKDKEAGGMLIGSILVNSNVLTIRDYTPPLKGDYQSRYRFIRRKDSHNNLLYKKWKASNRTIMYIGSGIHIPKKIHIIHNKILRIG